MTSYITYIIILTALIIGLAVQTTPDFDVNTLKDNLVWTNVELNKTVQPDLTHALESLINGIGEASYSFVKWVAEWSSQNPNVPFKLLIFCTMLAIFTPIIILLFKLSIIIFLLTKEYIQNKRDKKELNKLKQKND